MASIPVEHPLDARAGGVAQRAAWKWPLLALAGCVAWTIVCYWPVAAEMVETWARTTTYNHGFVVPPLVLWLAWRLRGELAAVEPRPSPWPLLAVAAMGALALAGVLGRVNALSQFAFLASVVLIVPAVLGLQVARLLAFPLLFLFFALPVGDFLLPRLMDWTADFTVAALRATGIPVYRQGLVFVIPSGAWSVVEACSGVRYLIASLMVGTLYAYLTYRSTKRRAIFIACAAVVPILANWMRAYLIVLLGHLSNNRLAVGVDHLIYGWIFFGIVVGAMFWIGARWREPDAMPDPKRAASRRDGPAAPSGYWGVALALAVIVGISGAAQQRVIASTAGRSALPVVLAFQPAAGWQSTPPMPTSWSPQFVAPSGTLAQSFAKDGRTVGLYVAYYRGQSATRKLVSSANSIVSTSDPRWSRVSEPDALARVAGQSVALRSERIVSTQTSDEITARQLYWIDGRLTASDVVAKIYTAWSELRSGRDDSAVVIVYAHGNGTAAAQAIDHFLADNGAAILAMLRAAAGTAS